MKRHPRLNRRLWVVAYLCLFPAASTAGGDAFEAERHRMADEVARAETITNVRVIETLRTVPRHQFVARKWRHLAYRDTAVPIGHAQTATPPSMVAYMLQQLDPQPQDRVLEIGTGCGYQAAVLSRMVRAVYTIEIVPALAAQARDRLRRLDCDNAHVRLGDGYQGWPGMAPFDKILLTCSPETVPAPLAEQLAEGGRLVVPLGEPYRQRLCLFVKTNGHLQLETAAPTAFVLMTGEAQAARRLHEGPIEPALTNGSFEETLPDSEVLAGWYHQRQLTLESGRGAPDGHRFVTFRNFEAGRVAHAAQAFAIDGRHTRNLRLSGLVRGADLRPGTEPHMIATASIAFYDKERRPIGLQAVGDWRGTFAWTGFSGRIAVPKAAREAVVQIGLEGATGTASFDRLAVVPDGL